MTKSAHTASVADKLKWFVVATLSFFLVYTAINGKTSFGLSSATYWLVISLLFVSTMAIAMLTRHGKSVLNFCFGAKSELKKVVWPQFSETRMSTLVVFAVVFVVSIYIAISDLVIDRFVLFFTT